MLDATLKSYATRVGGTLALALALAAPLALTDRPAARTVIAGPEVLSGIARVIDGDTISIGVTHIRLEGIDAPESAQTCGAAAGGTWGCGQAAANALAHLLAGREVKCDSHGSDKYGRTLASCFVDGRDISAEMVRQGMAWAFVRYSTAYVPIEAEARAHKVGIWQGEAQPAWEYRHHRWAAAEDTAPKGCAIKGNVTANGHIYHMPWSPWYAQIKMEPDKGKRWFCSEADAVAAGWRPVRIH